MDSVAYLIKSTYELDAIGNQIAVEQRVEVLVSVLNIGQNEFFAASNVGLKPSVKLSISTVDYDGEEAVQYGDTVYTIYRTYAPHDADRIELYLGERMGISGKSRTD